MLFDWWFSVVFQCKRRVCCLFLGLSRVLQVAFLERIGCILAGLRVISGCLWEESMLSGW